MKKEKNIQALFITIIVIFTVIQVLGYLHNSISVKENKVKIVSESNKEIIKFSTINNELKQIENIEINDINHNTEGWKIKVALCGDNNNVIDSLNKLNNMEKYTINNYNIVGKDGVFSVELDLYRKN